MKRINLIIGKYYTIHAMEFLNAFLSGYSKITVINIELARKDINEVQIKTLLCLSEPQFTKISNALKVCQALDTKRIFIMKTLTYLSLQVDSSGDMISIYSCIPHLLLTDN